VSFPPGGDTDALARLFAEKLAARVGQPVIVENKTGASGTIGNSFVAKATPDGYTLLFTPNTMATAPLVLKPGSGAVYDPLTDFTPIMLAGTQSLLLVVNTATGIKDMKDFVAAAQPARSPTTPAPEAARRCTSWARPSTSPPASSSRKCRTAARVPPSWTSSAAISRFSTPRWVPWRSTWRAAIGVADPARSPLQPGVPTFAEAGFRDSEVGAWQGFVGPKGLPTDVVRTLNSHLNEILKMPDVAERMKTLALVPKGGEPAAISRVIANDHSRYGKVIKEAGIQVE